MVREPGKKQGNKTDKKNKQTKPSFITAERANGQHIHGDLTEIWLRKMEAKAGREPDEAGFQRCGGLKGSQVRKAHDLERLIFSCYSENGLRGKVKMQTHTKKREIGERRRDINSFSQDRSTE